VDCVEDAKGVDVNVEEELDESGAAYDVLDEQTAQWTSSAHAAPSRMPLDDESESVEGDARDDDEDGAEFNANETEESLNM